MRILERGDQQQTTRGVIAGAAVVGQCHKSSAVKNQMTKLLPGWGGKRSGGERQRGKSGVWRDRYQRYATHE